jgi:hypothetical protein
LLSRSSRCPRRKAARSRSSPLGAAQKNMIGHQ